MTWILALDENVFYYAAKKEDAAGKKDETCYAVFIAMGNGGHRMCATPALWARLSATIDLLKHIQAPVIPQISKVIGNALRTIAWVQGDVMSLDDARLVREGHGEGDLEVTKSAAGAPDVGAKGLISTDQPLLNDLKTWSIPTKYGFASLTPSEALIHL